MNKAKQIPIFELNEGAKAGFFMRSINNAFDEVGHDVMQAHRDDSYLLFVLKAGTCRVLIDFEELVFQNSTCCLIHPDQVHRVLEGNILDGWMLAFDPGLLTQETMSLVAQFTFLSIPTQQNDSLVTIDTFTQLLWQTFQFDQQGGAQSLTLRYLLNALINLLVGLDQTTRPARNTSASRGYEITTTFRQLLKANFHVWKRPAQYAQQLHLSVNHLNDVVKEKTGYSVSYWIQYQTMLEAKRQLYHTQQTVKEIAYQLGFDDQHYFSRLFRNVTGQAPIAFRHSFRDLSTTNPR